MGASFGSIIRFRCPRCMVELKAKPAHVGTWRPCPRCQFRLKVPTAEEAERLAAMRHAAGEYAMGDADKVDDRPYLSVRCGLCSARIDATPDQIGQQIACPDCGTMVVIKPLATPNEKPKMPSHAIDDEYDVCEGLDQPDYTHKLVHQKYVRMHCPVCGTHLLATLDQVGQKIVCPDCEVASTVLPPDEAPEELLHLDLAPEEHDEYSLIPDAPPDSPNVPGEGTESRQPAYVKLICPHCHTRLPATADQVGQQVVCPDCGTTTIVPELKAPAPDLASELPMIGGYAVGEAIVRPEYHHREDYRESAREADDTADAPGAPPVDARPLKPEAVTASRPKPPARPDLPDASFTPRLLSFLRDDGVWQRWLGLSAGAVPILFLIATGLAMAMSSGPGQGDPRVTFIAMMMLALSGLFALIWSAVAAALLLVVIQETSEGCDQIEEWLDGVFTDWIFHVLFIVNSLGAATFAGVMLRGALREYLGIHFWLAMPITIVLVFPILLLSMMETGSVFNPVSTPVWMSMRLAWPAWSKFYVKSALLTAAVVSFTAAVVWLAGLWGSAVISPLLIAAAFIYARLLGGLAWVCRSIVAQLEDDEEE